MPKTLGHRGPDKSGSPANLAPPRPLGRANNRAATMHKQGASTSRPQSLPRDRHRRSHPNHEKHPSPGDAARRACEALAAANHMRWVTLIHTSRQTPQSPLREKNTATALQRPTSAFVNAILPPLHASLPIGGLGGGNEPDHGGYGYGAPKCLGNKTPWSIMRSVPFLRANRDSVTGTGTPLPPSISAGQRREEREQRKMFVPTSPPSSSS